MIGSGWIGAEFAASARMRGADVTVIDPVSVPLERVLGPEVGAIYRDLHREHGVQLRLGTGVEGFEGERSVRAVKTRMGARSSATPSSSASVSFPASSSPKQPA